LIKKTKKGRGVKAVMAIGNPYQVYKNQSVMLASREELTLMLYNGCVKFIRQADMAIENKNISKANEYIIRAQDIIAELMSTLDMSFEVSKGLAGIYDYMTRRLIDANIHKDSSILEEVLELAIQLRNTWNEAMQIASHKPAAVRG